MVLSLDVDGILFHSNADTIFSGDYFLRCVMLSIFETRHSMRIVSALGTLWEPGAALPQFTASALVPLSLE